MDSKSDKLKNDQDQVVFAQEDDSTQLPNDARTKKNLWKILVVDDEADVNEITRITLRGYTFESRGVQIISAFNEQDVKSVLAQDNDIALILLDVVMEKDDSGLRLVEYIRKQLNNHAVRIVLRTGQPGKAPEQEVITKYDINDYKTKPELTAQKLYTSVTACLRAYNNLKTIEKSNQGLEAIIESIVAVFKNQSFSNFGSGVLNQLECILGSNFTSTMHCAYFIQMPDDDIAMMAGTGKYAGQMGTKFDTLMPTHIIAATHENLDTGGESFIDDEYIGVFKTKEGFLSLLYLDQYQSLTEVQKKLLSIYANTIAIGFDNIRLTREIINTQKEVILTLGEIVETRSQETANHVARVAEFCYFLAKKHGFDPETCEMVRLASPMHDVGKIGISEAVLNKPGRLTPDEFRIIQDHARIGYHILNKSNRPIMKTAAVIALHHHEKWDGSGYPNGLSGEDIHVFGRIAAIADVFDALSHKRCYKEAWPMEKVIDHFKNESGHHFDPDFVSIFLENIKEFEAINKLFPE